MVFWTSTTAKRSNKITTGRSPAVIAVYNRKEDGECPMFFEVLTEIAHIAKTGAHCDLADGKLCDLQ